MKAYFSKARVKWRLNLNPSLPFSPAPPDSVGATQGQCSNGWCWPHCGTGHERTAVYHKEVGNIVGLVPGIHYRGLRTISHACRSREVAGPGIRFLVVDFGCAGGLKEFASALCAVLLHSTGIFREGINNTRRRNTTRVLCLKVELNSIILVGQILPNGGDMNDMGKAASHHAVMIASPGHIRAQRCAHARNRALHCSHGIVGCRTARRPSADSRPCTRKKCHALRARRGAYNLFLPGRKSWLDHRGIASIWNSATGAACQSRWRR